MSLYKTLQSREMIKDVSDETLAKRLLDQEQTSFYCGFDPTGQSLTVGHLVQIVRMKLLQQHGHHPIVLIGGATGLIGDPKQTSERKLLTLEESLENAATIEKQLKHFLGEDATYVNNYDWIRNIDMIGFLRDYGKQFSINYMLAKDTVAKRLETGISYTEFSYMLIQAIDFLHLYNNHQCKIQFGGSDQWGNITTGLELIRKTNQNSEALGLSSPLLLRSDGTKFGKSESGTLWLDETLTSAYELYQYFLNASDADVLNYLYMLTLLSNEDIKKIMDDHENAPHLRHAQKVLAKEVVEMVHGQKGLLQAENVTKALFEGTFDLLTKDDFKVLALVLQTTEEVDIMDALIALDLASSKREAKEFIMNQAVSVNGNKITDSAYTFSNIDAYHEKFIVLRRGKKKYGLIILN
ncbi:MAG: tyrosine--tRNA ligase [Firmicutes bacterium]|nr:tyrosine--tRNA ligase [Bacillota bacterium]